MKSSTVRTIASTAATVSNTTSRSIKKIKCNPVANSDQADAATKTSDLNGVADSTGTQAEKSVHIETRIGNKKAMKQTLDDDNNEREKTGWNDMLHLSIKRFNDDDSTLTDGAKRNRVKYPHIATAEYAKSGRSICKHCGTAIQPKGTVRMNFMMECHKGYRTACTVHELCFWKHREVSKLNFVDEIYIHPQILQDDPTFKDKLSEQFNIMVKHKQSK
jgi:hypothetical protein